VPPAPLPAPVSHAPSVEPPPRPRRRAPMVLAGVGTLVAVVAGVLLTQDGGSGAGTTGGAPFTADPAVVLTPPAPVASDTSTGSAEPPGRADSPGRRRRPRHRPSRRHRLAARHRSHRPSARRLRSAAAGTRPPRRPRAVPSRTGRSTASRSRSIR
jgi:hypothetical protein